MIKTDCTLILSRYSMYISISLKVKVSRLKSPIPKNDTKFEKIVKYGRASLIFVSDEHFLIETKVHLSILNWHYL